MNDFQGRNYTVPQLDLSERDGDIPEKYSYLYEQTVVDDSGEYLGHPDSVLLKNGDILTVYPLGHGRGAVLNRISTDGGRSYAGRIKNPPESWKRSLETPTVYRLEFSDGTKDKLILISANSKWPGLDTPGGFNCSVSCDEGETWSEFETFFSKADGYELIPIVAMASLTRLKENGKFVDKWMGFFHDADFYNYKTILSFTPDGRMRWSEPEKYFARHRDVEKRSNMCEVEVIRSGAGIGDELCLISRSNTKKENSLISFSRDEGRTWSDPVHAPAALNGERHKADYLRDGRLFITFRSIERDPEKVKKYSDNGDWYSEGWTAWIGSYDDLKNGTQGDYRIKLAHTYFDDQTSPQPAANADTAYCGNVVLGDGTVVTASYGKFGERNADGGYKTYIVSKRIDPKDTDELVKIDNK